MTGWTGGQDQRDYFASRPTIPAWARCVITSASAGARACRAMSSCPAYPGYSQGLRRAGPYGGYLGSRYNPLFSTADPTFPRQRQARQGRLRSDARGHGRSDACRCRAAVTLDALDRRRTLAGASQRGSAAGWHRPACKR